MNRRGGHILAFALATCGTFNAARATDLSATVSSTECSLEEVVGINVEVLNPTQASAPVPDATDDFEIRLVAGPARSSNTTIINGVMDSRVTYTYSFEARPKRTGKISVPGFSLTDGGTTYRTKPLVISVTKTAGKGNGDVFAKVIVPRTTAFLGEPVDARLEVFVKQYTQQGIQPFTVNTTFKLSQLNISRFGVFEKAMTNTPNYRMSKLRDDRGILADYFVFYWETSIYPKEVGPFDFGDILIAWKYPTFVTRGFMGLDLNNPRNLRVVPELPALEIRPIPLEGRPADYNGAIGTFTYQVNASPRVAPVGDPITLTMTIRSSDAPLDRVSPPRLDQVPGLVKDFELSGDSLAGDVSAGQKSFSQTIRALREDVTELPSLPFSFFNPEKAVYETIWTPPIPLTINAAERVALPEGAAASGPQPSMAPLVETAAGLRANHSNVDAMLADHGGGFGAVSIAFFAAMPIVFLASWFIARRSDLYQSDVALRRRRFALSTARKALDKAARSSSAPAIGAALLGYVADRYNAPSAGMTRADAVSRLQSSRVAADVVNEMNGLLESLEFAQYGGMAGVSIEEATSRARRIIDGLEKIELS